jgi:hypothetical protein
LDWLGDIFLFLHVSGVIVAFGPTIAFPILAARAQNEPMHGNFVLRMTEFITNRVVEPGAVFVFLMGVGAIVTRGWNPLEQFWLASAIVLFIGVFAYVNLVQAPRVRRMIELTARPPVLAAGDPAMAGAPTLAGPGAAATPEAAQAGPPPEFLELAAKAGRAGMVSTVILFVIVALMVFKPAF